MDNHGLVSEVREVVYVLGPSQLTVEVCLANNVYWCMGLVTAKGHEHKGHARRLLKRFFERIAGARLNCGIVSDRMHTKLGQFVKNLAKKYQVTLTDNYHHDPQWKE